jgi:hypothetical protein
MSAAGSSISPVRLWLVVGGALLVLVLGANAHFLYVAITSQPACVTHVRTGEGSADRGVFSAAQSSCSPSRTGDKS